MKIVLINTSKDGGAAEACLNLLSGLENLGLQVTLLTLDDVSFYNKNIWAKILYKWQSRKVIRYRRKLIADAPKGFDYFSFPLSRYKDFYRHPAIQSADVINLHWVANLLDYPSFFANVRKPIVWTLHDLNGFTGGCHYTYGCAQYEDNCGNCPQLSVSSRYKANKALRMKAKLLHQFNYVVSPSTWINQLSLKSKVFNKYDHSVIPNSVNSTIFKYSEDLDNSKMKLGLQNDKFIISFVATDVNSSRKGADILVRLQRQFSQESKVIFLCVGNWDEQNTSIIRFGFVKNKHKLAEIYNSSDIFIIPSRQDNLPNTMLEALCCGTPVIGFDIGGIPDAIEHGKNGYLVPLDSFEPMVQYIQDLMSGHGKLNERKKISDNAIEKYSLEKQAIAYNNIYKRILKKFNSE